MRKRKIPPKTWWITLVLLLLLTLLFDNIIIWAGIVEYDTSKLLGIFAGYAPIEDFFYAILAASIVPILWERFTASPTDEGKA